MRIIQFGTTGAVLILQQEIKYLQIDIISIGNAFFCFRREVHNSLSLVLHHGECVVPLVSARSFLVGMTSSESILQTSFGSEVL